MNKTILVTGVSGFIGYHLAKSLLIDGIKVIGIDNINSYYDANLKNARLKEISSYKDFTFKRIDISNRLELNKIFIEYKPFKVVNLAAQAGVRYSLKNPFAYMDTNIVGFLNILEFCKDYKIEGLIYASSSSVYGNNKKIPFSTTDRVDNPISLYAATKKSNELMAYTYSHLYNLNTTGLRFFTVYGPWGRPDMAYYIFTNRILNNKKIDVYNKGNMKRDFTYIDDIILGLRSAIDKNYKCEIFNLGNNKSERLMDFIGVIEKELRIKAKINFKSIQPGDVQKTYADINKTKKMLSYDPKINLKDGIKFFIEWYKKFYNH